MGVGGVGGQELGLDCQGGYVPLERAEKFEKNIISSFQGAFKHPLMFEKSMNFVLP